MGKSPAIIFVVRHAARLDAADPQWHLTSPTPYDPPLTYGGWKQAQALGARIGSIIRYREDGRDAASGRGPDLHQHPAKRRRRHKVVVHSSPFRRCVQSSFAINAGMNNWLGKLDYDEKHSLSKQHHQMHSGTPHIHAFDGDNSPHLSAIPEPDAIGPRRLLETAAANRSSEVNSKTPLRLDAFLGEWLSPDYFENITSPPDSRMMMLAAKADVLRRFELGESHTAGQDLKMSKGNFPGGWAGLQTSIDRSPKVSRNETKPIKESEHLPKLSRSKTHTPSTTGKRFQGNLTPFHENVGPLDSTGYNPPTPPYAVSPAQPIPQGYVTHASDACTDVDLEWDSMKPPLEWGDGGEFGEEWSAMHRRFRKGVHEMISWYRQHDLSDEPDPGNGEPEALHHASTQPSKDPDEEEAETVLVLVTHGAGCNALIGALTNQPVLIDVGLASLTMAVRKDSADGKFAPFNPNTIYRRRASYDQGTAEEYEVKLTASVDHLRAGSQFLGAPKTRARSPSLPIREKSPYRYERHVRSPTRRNFSQSPVRKKSPSVSNGPSGETDSKPTPGDSFEEVETAGQLRRASTALDSTNGLWSRPSNLPSSPLSQTHKLSLNQPTKSSPPQQNGNGNVSANGKSPIAKPDSSNGAGLWNANSRMIDHLRDHTTPKRRWTSGPARS